MLTVLSRRDYSPLTPHDLWTHQYNCQVRQLALYCCKVASSVLMYFPSYRISSVFATKYSNNKFQKQRTKLINFEYENSRHGIYWFPIWVLKYWFTRASINLNKIILVNKFQPDITTNKNKHYHFMLIAALKWKYFDIIVII